MAAFCIIFRANRITRNKLAQEITLFVYDQEMNEAEKSTILNEDFPGLISRSKNMVR
jgi:hypothetical protein